MSEEDFIEGKKVWYKSIWVWFWLALIFIVVSVNIYMIMQSMNEFPGLVVDDYYERGQDYEENMYKKLTLNKQWKTNFTLQNTFFQQKTLINFEIRDSSTNAYMDPDEIKLFIYRPSNSTEDFTHAITKIDIGRYQSEIIFPLKGKWDLLVNAKIGDADVNYGQTIYIQDAP